MDELTKSVLPFMIAEFIAMFLMMLFPSRAPCRPSGWAAETRVPVVRPATWPHPFPLIHKPKVAACNQGDALPWMTEP